MKNSTLLLIAAAVAAFLYFQKQNGDSVAQRRAYLKRARPNLSPAAAAAWGSIIDRLTDNEVTAAYNYFKWLEGGNSVATMPTAYSSAIAAINAKYGL